MIDSKGTYSPGYGEKLVESYAQRGVAREAKFLVPHLKAGMNLLDCGCGPGTITIGLAALLSEGKVTGIDRESSQIELALTNAKRQDTANAFFRVGSVYELPFEDEEFDVVFAHAVLQHLNEPVQALQEMRRVLKPGGIIGVRDDDQGSLIMYPANENLRAMLSLFRRIMLHHGGNAEVGRQHRALLRQAGFVRTQASASTECDGTSAETIKRSEIADELLQTMNKVIVSQGWATSKEVDEIRTACKEWGHHPDAFDVITWCEAIGWKDA